MDNIVSRPIFFEKNRVGRVYKGGKLFSTFFGDQSNDGNSPEEWMASVVSSLKGNTSGIQEGVSIVRGQQVSFAQLLKDYTLQMLGDSKFDVLCKVLDSAIRLPVQAHPDRQFAKTHFNSDYGKTEMWLILDTRPGACCYYGFKQGVTREQFEKAIDDSETDDKAMSNLLNCFPVKAGDVFFIPAGIIHAIGAGCLIFEAQEPTDFTIEPEAWCGDYNLNEKERFMGLDRKTAIDCIDFNIGQEQLRQIGMPKAKILTQQDGIVKESIISNQQTPMFTINRYNVTQQRSITLDTAPALYLVTDGNGNLVGDEYQMDIKKGDYFFMPYAARNKFVIKSNNIQLVETTAHTS